MRALRLVLAGFLAVVLATGAFAGSAQPRSNGGCYGGPNLPLDAGVAGITSAYSTCALSKNWLNRNFADVIANGVTYTIRFVNGVPDVRRLAQLMGNINPNFGRGALPLAKWYDQTGTSDCVQTTAANRMSVWLINGVVSIAGDGYFVNSITGSAVDRFCRAAAGSYNAQASTFYFAGTMIQGTAPAYTVGVAGVLFQTGAGCCSGGAGAGWQAMKVEGGSGSPSKFGTFDWSTFSGPTIAQLWPENQRAVIGAIFSSSTVTYTQNEETAVNCGGSCALSAQTATGLTVGADQSNAGLGYYGQFQAALAFGGTALSGGNQTTIRNSLYQLFKIPSTQSYSVIVDGASFDTNGGGLVGGINGLGWGEQMYLQIPYAAKMINMARWGATISDINTAWSGLSSVPCVGTYTKSVLIGPSFAAGNSINGGETGAQAYSDLQTYLTTVRSKCTFDAILVGTLPGTGEFLNYTNLVKANAGTLNISVVDWAANTTISQPNTNPVLFNQASPYTAHPTAVGYSYYVPAPLSGLRAAFGK